MTNRIQKPETPALPLSESEYKKSYFDQTFNILRLFFNRLVNAFNQLVSTDNGGRFLYSPNGVFYSTQDQIATNADTGYPITYNNTYLSNGIRLTDSSRVAVDHDGVYQFLFTAMVESNNASASRVHIWINRNGTAFPYTTKEYSIAGSGQELALTWEFIFDLEAGDYIEMYWATSNTNVELHTRAATTPHTGVPSAVMCVTFASNL